MAHENSGSLKKKSSYLKDSFFSVARMLLRGGCLRSEHRQVGSTTALASSVAAAGAAALAPPSDSEGDIGDQMSPSAIQHRALKRINQSRGPAGRAFPGSGGGRRGSRVAGQVGAGTLDDTIAPND